MKYGVVIIFYNPDEEAIERIRVYSENFDEVLVVDNSENKKDEISKKLNKYENCIYHKMNGNEGMAKALNYAFFRAIDRNYDFILSMDQDSIYTEENIRKMKSYIEKNVDEKIGIYSPNYSKLYYDEKKEEFIAEKPIIGENEIRNVDFCMTSGSFVNVKSLKEILPLDDYFIAYVDNFLCAKLKENNYKLLMVGSSYFAQQVGGVIKNNLINRVFHVLHHSEIRYYYMVRNNLFLQKRFRKNKRIYKSSKINLLRILLNLILFEKNKLKKIEACISGYIDFKHNVMGKVNDGSIMW